MREPSDNSTQVPAEAAHSAGPTAVMDDEHRIAVLMQHGLTCEQAASLLAEARARLSRRALPARRSKRQTQSYASLRGSHTSCNCAREHARTR
jgi:hypothetical protein